MGYIQDWFGLFKKKGTHIAETEYYIVISSVKEAYKHSLKGLQVPHHNASKTVETAKFQS